MSISYTQSDFVVYSGHILIPSVLEMREQLMKFRITETSHGK
jgi:hypothetical protein